MYVAFDAVLVPALASSFVKSIIAFLTFRGSWPVTSIEAAAGGPACGEGGMLVDPSRGASRPLPSSPATPPELKAPVPSAVDTLRFVKSGKVFVAPGVADPDPSSDDRFLAEASTIARRGVGFLAGAADDNPEDLATFGTTGVYVVFFLFKKSAIGAISFGGAGTGRRCTGVPFVEDLGL